jgi:hypothetical protein
MSSPPATTPQSPVIPSPEVEPISELLSDAFLKDPKFLVTALVGGLAIFLYLLCECLASDLMTKEPGLMLVCGMDVLRIRWIHLERIVLPVKERKRRRTRRRPHRTIR